MEQSIFVECGFGYLAEIMVRGTEEAPEYVPYSGGSFPTPEEAAEADYAATFL